MTAPTELDERALEAAVRECARITAPEISDETFERHRAEGTIAFKNTSEEIGRIIAAYLGAQTQISEPVITLSTAVVEAEKLGFLSVEDLHRLSTEGAMPVAHAYVVDGKCEEIAWGDPALPHDPSLIRLYASPQPTNPAQVTDAKVPAYGTVDFLELGKDVNEAVIGQRLDFDFGDGYPGHAMLPALNFNSLSRIVSKYITAAIGAGGQAVASESLTGQPYNPDDERFAKLLDSQWRAGRTAGWNECFAQYVSHEEL